MLKVLLVVSLLTSAIAVPAALIATQGKEAAEARVAAYKHDDGRVEFAIQVRERSGWSERILPQGRFLASHAATGRWISSTPVSLPDLAAAESGETSSDSSEQQSISGTHLSWAERYDGLVKVFALTDDGFLNVMQINFHCYFDEFVEREEFVVSIDVTNDEDGWFAHAGPTSSNQYVSTWNGATLPWANYYGQRRYNEQTGLYEWRDYWQPVWGAGAGGVFGGSTTGIVLLSSVSRVRIADDPETPIPGREYKTHQQIMTADQFVDGLARKPSGELRFWVYNYRNASGNMGIVARIDFADHLGGIEEVRRECGDV